MQAKKKFRSRSVSKMADKTSKGKVVSNRYINNWFTRYFNDLPKDATPRFPPNPDVALRSSSADSNLAERCPSDWSSQLLYYQAEAPSVRHISPAS